METELQLRNEWINCVRCPLGLTARHHVWSENVLFSSEFEKILGCDASIDVMMVGEAPGVGEDVLGRPFVGSSGRLLRQSIKLSLDSRSTVTVCLNNCCICRPFAQSPASTQNRAPEPLEAEACAPRLESLIRILRPKLIIALGNVPGEYMEAIIEESGHQCLYSKLKHPAWVVRQLDKDIATEIYVDSFRKEWEKI